MKKTVVRLFAFALMSLIIICLFTGCSQKADVDKLLSYQNRSEHSVVLCADEDKYNMNLSLEDYDSSCKFRDGSAEISDGILNGVVFEMDDGMLKMKADDFEIELTQEDSAVLYSLFSAFSISKNDFIGVTEDTDSETGKATLNARFSGNYKPEITLDGESFEPISIEIQSPKDTYIIKFANNLQESTNKDGSDTQP